MKTRFAFAVSASALAFFIRASVVAAQPPVRDLPKPTTEIDNPFSLVIGAVEISGGRLIVADGVEGLLSVVDFAKGERTQLGRQGSGPGEYRTPAGVFRMQGDTIWVFDAAAMRMVVFNPDLTPGTPFSFIIFDQATNTALTAPFFSDRRGRLYASAMSIQIGRNGGTGTLALPDSVGFVRLDPRDKKTRIEMARIRYPVSGKPEIKQNGNNIQYTMAYPGLVSADALAVFPDGRVALVHGGDYTVEFLAPDGKHSASTKISYDRIPVTGADRKAEMDEMRKQTAEQGRAAKRMLPPNINMTFEITEPASWPDNYPAVTPLGALAAPDGRLWTKRAIPTRVGQEQWDVIDPSGKLVQRWKLPAKVTMVAVGQGVVYTVRKDEDDLRYVQRVVIPK